MTKVTTKSIMSTRACIVGDTSFYAHPSGTGSLDDVWFTTVTADSGARFQTCFGGYLELSYTEVKS